MKWTVRKGGYERKEMQEINWKGKYGRDDTVYCEYEGKAREVEHEGRNIKRGLGIE